MLMLYFSGTGNSRYISKQFAARMGCGCLSIEDSADFDSLIRKNGTIAVCYPIYGSCVPRIMREFAKEHSEALKDKKLIIFCTQMIFSGDGARAFARLLPGCDKNVIYAEHFNMPNNISNSGFLPISDFERKRKKRHADKKLRRVCRDIKKGTVKRRGWNSFSQFLGKMQNSGWLEVEDKQRGSFEADSDCIKCGLCVKRCPVHNLELSENGVVQKNNCILCYRCVNICPMKAASVLIHKKPKRQYNGIVKKK